MAHMTQEGIPVFEASDRKPIPLFEIKIQGEDIVTYPELYFVLRNKDIIYIL